MDLEQLNQNQEVIELLMAEVGLTNIPAELEVQIAEVFDAISKDQEKLIAEQDGPIPTELWQEEESKYDV